jgi:ribosomal protein S18 acetylase RimI-like enzyme
MECNIRRASVADARAIAHVQVAGWKATYSGIVPQEFLDSLDEETRATSWREHLERGGNSFFVAETRELAFGFACGGTIREPLGDCDAELYAIYLLPAFQKQGAGRQLVHALAADLRHGGFKRIAVWVLELNPAVSFYKRMGGIQLAREQIEIGGALLGDLAFGLDLHSPELQSDPPN